MNPKIGETVTQIFAKRCGVWSNVTLKGGKLICVFDVAAGRDLGDEYDHFTTNCSPGPVDDADVHFFYANEVIKIEDGLSGDVLFDISWHSG